MNDRSQGVHPFIGEGFDRERALQFWDDVAGSYSGAQQGTMVGEIVDHLHKKGTIDRSKTVLELGCGQGTYSLRIAPLVRSITCIDTSKRMLDRLSSSAKDLGIDNLKALHMDFQDYPPDDKHSVVVSSLCPGTGSIEGLRKMELCAKETCAHIMWIVNKRDDIHAEIWKELGKNYSFESRRSDLVNEALRSLGRDPQVTEFSAKVEQYEEVEGAISHQVRDFQQFGLGPEIRPAIRRVLDPMIEGDLVHYQGVNRMRLIVWTI